jgi:hypothetical protein
VSAYFFRFVDDEGPTGYVGFAYAKTKAELFWMIDEFGDPYGVELKTAPRGCGFCVFQDPEDGHSQHEISQSLPFRDLEKKGWKKPDWEGVLAP